MALEHLIARVIWLPVFLKEQLEDGDWLMVFLESKMGAPGGHSG